MDYEPALQEDFAKLRIRNFRIKGSVHVDSVGLEKILFKHTLWLLLGLTLPTDHTSKGYFAFTSKSGTLHKESQAVCMLILGRRG